MPLLDGKFGIWCAVSATRFKVAIFHVGAVITEEHDEQILDLLVKT
jgi:hypothetical protein